MKVQISLFESRVFSEYVFFFLKIFLKVSFFKYFFMKWPKFLFLKKTV